MTDYKGEAGPAGREGQPGPAGREGHAGREGPQGTEGIEGVIGKVGKTGPAGVTGMTGKVGPEGPMGPPGSTEVIVDLTTAQQDLAAAVRLLYRGVRRLIILALFASAAVIIFGVVFVRLGNTIREEGLAGRQQLKCVVAVLFRQDPPACPGIKDQLIREGILPPGFPSTTTTTRL